MLFLTATIACGNVDSGRIILIPVGKVSPVRVRSVLKVIRETYSLPAVLHKPIPLPASAYYPPRHRYQAAKLFPSLIAIGTRDDKVIGITERDISTPKGNKDWGVMGLGQLDGKACVISSFRTKTQSILSATALHELGHTFGLPHCPARSCLMRDAEGGKKKADLKYTKFCANCRKALQSQSVLR